MGLAVSSCLPCVPRTLRLAWARSTLAPSAGAAIFFLTDYAATLIKLHFVMAYFVC